MDKFLVILFINNFIVLFMFSEYLKILESKNNLLEEKIDFFITTTNNQITSLINSTNTKVLEIKILEDKIDTLVSSTSVIEKKINFIPAEYLNIAYDLIQPITPYIVPTIVLVCSYMYLTNVFSLMHQQFGTLLNQHYNLLIDAPVNYVVNTVYDYTIFHPTVISTVSAAFGLSSIPVNNISSVATEALATAALTNGVSSSIPNIIIDTANSNALAAITEAVVNNPIIHTENVQNFLNSFY
jgi:hypothetical protein